MSSMATTYVIVLRIYEEFIKFVIYRRIKEQEEYYVEYIVPIFTVLCLRIMDLTMPVRIEYFEVKQGTTTR